MTDRSEHPERDEAMAGALAALDVPDHGPRFWDELDAALADTALADTALADTALAETAPPTSSAPPPGDEPGDHDRRNGTGPTPSIVLVADAATPGREAARPPSPRRLVVRGLAIAALVLAAVTMFAALRPARDAQIEADPADATSSTTASSTTAPATTVASTTSEAQAPTTEAGATALPFDLDAIAPGVVGVEEAVSQFTTVFACCQPRVDNIGRIAELTNGAVIPARGSFSLNDHVGERTVENGFVAGGELVDGEVVLDIGGGVSQYATTLFNAAFFAGLEFEEYRSHSLYLSRYPRGREAALSWPTPDLVIHNPSPYDVVIWSSQTETSITVELYSTRHVTVEAGPVVRTEEDQCARYTTPRTRTYEDGFWLDAEHARSGEPTITDEVFALYRPGEGLDCSGGPG